MILSILLIFSLCVGPNTVIGQNQNVGGASMLPYLGNNDSDGTQRPAIHTFMYGVDPKQAFESNDLVRIWAEAWAEAGWNPVFLTENDASKHPDYEKFITQLKAANIPELRWERFLPYIAMSIQGGGWYSKSYVIPIRSDLFGGKGLNLPNEGKFTMHEKDLPELLSGSQDEWNKIASLMMNKPTDNDALLLRTLMSSNPDLIEVEDSILNSRHVLDKDLRLELCDALDGKLAAKFSYPIAQYTGFARKYYYEAVRSSLDELEEKCLAPVMHTFCEPSFGNKWTDNKLLEELEEWKKAWKKAGWRPVVLNLQDAKKHALFNTFEEAFSNAQYKTSPYDRMCFYRWLAMAANGGGWMSDHDTYPLFLDAHQDGLTLPNEGKFTGHMLHIPCLVSGSKNEWERMTNLLLASYQKHTNEFWSDMLAFLEVRQVNHAYIPANDVISADVPYAGMDLSNGNGVPDPYNLKDRCKFTHKKKAIHFSHTACKKVGFCHEEQRGAVAAKWVETWKQQCLLKDITLQ